jgi:hypothetical protein
MFYIDLISVIVVTQMLGLQLEIRKDKGNKSKAPLRMNNVYK